MFKHDLGVRAKCRVTELVGIINSRSENINMCNRYFIQPKVEKEMKIPDGYWVDEDDIIVLDKGLNAKTKPTGGPMSKIR